MGRGLGARTESWCRRWGGGSDAAYGELWSARFGPTVRVAVTGALCVATASAIEEGLADLVDDAETRLVIDLSAVTRVDARGGSVVIDAADRCARRGVEFVVEQPSDEVSRLLDLWGHSRSLTINVRPVLQ